MKKRDYYILGLLVCLVVFASMNRKLDAKNKMATQKELKTPVLKASVNVNSSDSIQKAETKVIKAEV